MGNNTDEKNKKKVDDRQRLVRFDWAIKRLLRNKANFDVLEGFLSVVLNQEVQVIEILESESNKQTENDKFNRVDIKARNAEDEIIIVEVQNTREVDYMLRMLYGVSKSVVEHIDSGEVYGDIKKVYSISVLYFNFGTGDDYVYRGTTEFRGMHTHNELILSSEERKLMGFASPSEVFPEYYLLMVEDFDKVAVTHLEEWMEFLKSGEIKETATAPGLQAAREKLRVIGMTKEEQNAYEKYLHDVASFMLTQKVEREFALAEGKEIGLAEGKEIGLAEGKEIGLAEGKEIGRAEGLSEGKEMGREEEKTVIAKNMLTLNIPIDVISQSTGLTPEEISKLSPI